MWTAETWNIKERIDTNKNGFVDTNEINDFIFDEKEWTNNLNELWDYLNWLYGLQLNNDIIKRGLTGYFLSPEWGNESKKIWDKIESNQQLDKREIALLYLQMINVSSYFKNSPSSTSSSNFDPNKPLQGDLLIFIRQQYKNLSYNPQVPKSPAQQFQDNQRKDQFWLYTKETPQNVEIPQIPELDENNLNYVYNYCNRLITRAEQNFPNDIANIRNNVRAEHYDVSREDLPEYARYDVLLFAFQKYCESIQNDLIKQAWYRNNQEFEQQIDELKRLGDEIWKEYPNIDEILNTVQKFAEEIEENKNKYFKDDEELERAQHDSEEFSTFIQTKSEEYKIDEIKASLGKDPETKEEAENCYKWITTIANFQEEISEKSQIYWDSIEKYSNYVKWNVEISERYPSINEYLEIRKQYSWKMQQYSSKIDFDKYEKYNNLKEDYKFKKDFHNISVLWNIIMNPQNEHFPILWVKNAQAEKQKKIDKFRDNLQKNGWPAYRLLTSISWLRNGFVSATIGVWTWLWYMLLSLCWKDTEDLNRRKQFYDNLLKANQSSQQSDPIYFIDENGDTHLNLNRHNSVSTVSSSISQMLVLITWWGAIWKWIGKLAWISSKVAAHNAWVFSLAFTTQIWQSFQEAKNQNLWWWAAFAYSILSAAPQAALELVSPNEILLWSWTNITKELIKNLVKDGSKKSFMMLWKAFLKNVWMEILEENIQEWLQTIAWNLINMFANGIWWTDLWVDWHRENFAETAIITTLTTWITTWTSYMLQMWNMSQQDKRKLFNDVVNNPEIYTSIMEMLDKAIAGQVNIPDTNIAALQQLKTALISVNDVWSALHEEWRKTQLNEDGTYKPKIETTEDKSWTEQHNWQNEVDIASTTFENLPNDRQYENLQAARVATSLVYEAIASGEDITQEMIEDMSEQVHEERRKRNPWEKSWNLDIPYDQLPEPEKVKDRNQVLLAIEVVRQNLQSDYFDWKSHKFNVSESQARSNSTNMDNILNEINEKNKSKKLRDLGKQISKQYKQATWEDIELTDEQLLSVLDAHEQDWVLWELTTWQLRQKVNILSETITDPKVRRFLLEAWFCGSLSTLLHSAQNFIQENLNAIDSSVDFLWRSINNAYKSSKKQANKWTLEQQAPQFYRIGEEVNIPRSDWRITRASITAIDATTWAFRVDWVENWIECYKLLSQEELDGVNYTQTNEHENTTYNQTNSHQVESSSFNEILPERQEHNYEIGQIVNIPRTDWRITRAYITHINASDSTYIAEREENWWHCQKLLTQEELNQVNYTQRNEQYNQAFSPQIESSTINEASTQTQEITPTQNIDQSQYWLNTDRKEMSEVRRNSDVVAIWDLHWEYLALKWNLEYAWLAKEVNWHLQWTWWNKKVVFQWDILSDRWTDGLKIINEIHQLREQARSKWWNIEIIVWNHDDFMISYLTWRNWVHKDWIDISIADWAWWIYKWQWKWILELVRDFYTWKPYYLNGNTYDFKKILKEGHGNILNNMRSHPEWRIILEEICKMKLVFQIDDVLYCHTNPTAWMLAYLTNWNIQSNIELLNQKYQWYLRKVLLWEWWPSISTREFNEISDLFLNTDNRDIGWIQNYINQLKNHWINMISHWHSGWHWTLAWHYIYDNNSVDINWLKIVDTDFSYWKNWQTDRNHSISVVQQNWWNVVTWDDAYYVEQQSSDSEYFWWKSHKFEITEGQARQNSKSMDNVLNDINEQNKHVMLQRLRENINEQYKQATWQELELTDEQLLSVLDAHEQDWVIWELTTGQLKQKVEILDKTITDPNIRRFLLEAWFCWNEWLVFDSNYVVIPNPENDLVYRINTKEKATEQQNKPWYQSLEQAKQSLQWIIDSLEGGPYTDRPQPLYQDEFQDNHKSENYEQDIDAFITYAQEREKAHKQIFLDLATEAKAKALFIWKPKEKDRILEKVRENYRKEKVWLEGIKDYTRATILFDTFADFGKWLKKLEDMKINNKIKDFTIKNRITNDWCNDIFVNIQTKDWYVSEVQFHVPEVLVFRDEKLGALAIARYQQDNIALNEHPLTKDIFDLSNEKYRNNLEFYNKIIDWLNEWKEKKLSLPTEQNQIVHDHDMYDIIRILETYKDTDIMRVLYPHFEPWTQVSEIRHYIDDLIADLKEMKSNLWDEALDWYRQRVQ